jgi:hypothetical protein
MELKVYIIIMYTHINFQINRVVDFFFFVYQNHEKANIIDNDGKDCYYCKLPIPLVYMTKISKNTGRCFVKVDRSNRVDVQLTHKSNFIEVVSYHVNCWRKIIFK